MDRQSSERWAFSCSGAGDNSDASFSVLIQRYKDGKPTEESFAYNGRVKLDGDQYGPGEWIREVLMGIIESF